MVFSSSIFLFAFLPMLLAVYFVVRDNYRNMVLLLASLIFYAWGEPKNIILMFTSILVNYTFGIFIDEFDRGKKIVLAGSIIYNLGTLIVFKYLNFLIDIVNHAVGSNIEIDPIELPIGISFFTFQIMSYVIDVYRGQAKVQKNLFDLALYVSLFPQLISGPIVRYTDIQNQIEDRKVSWDRAYEGFKRFAIGFSKKVLIADQLATLADVIFSGQYPSIWGHWIGAVAYALQIYFDFSGYSDMAIGLGKIFGFDFLENFDFPYISRSIQEFWRRWHMSLGTWFRDYLYIPLGGSRYGKARTCINLAVVFFLTGLWHGASYNFIIWGLFYALFLITERLGLKKLLEKLPSAAGHAYSLLVIIIGWVFFRADSLKDALIYIKLMFIPSGNDMVHFHFVMTTQYWCCIVLGIYFSIPHKKLSKMMRKTQLGVAFADALIVASFLIAICYMAGSGYSPFLYFRF